MPHFYIGFWTSIVNLLWLFLSIKYFLNSEFLNFGLKYLLRGKTLITNVTKFIIKNTNCEYNPTIVLNGYLYI